LVIPREHIEDVWSLDGVTAQVLADAVLVIARAVRQAFEPEGLNIIQSNGEAATQTVPHIHVHVVPRWHGDDMGPIWPTRRRHDEALLTGAAIELQEALGGKP
jgi:diadenosine tetraphosphate (Ap4A) HIT family hydrolase